MLQFGWTSKGPTVDSPRGSPQYLGLLRFQSWCAPDLLRRSIQCMYGLHSMHCLQGNSYFDGGIGTGLCIWAIWSSLYLKRLAFHTSNTLRTGIHPPEDCKSIYHRNTHIRPLLSIAVSRHGLEAKKIPTSGNWSKTMHNGPISSAYLGHSRWTSQYIWSANEGNWEWVLCCRCLRRPNHIDAW